MMARSLTPDYHVSPQISAEDIAELKAAGFALVICNRPDAEVPPSHQAAAIAAAAEAADLPFVVLPLTHQTMNAENVLRQKELAQSAGGPVLAYCASGTRCSVIWALGHAETLGADAVLEATAQAGYDLSGLRPTLTHLASR